MFLLKITVGQNVLSSKCFKFSLGKGLETTRIQCRCLKFLACSPRTKSKKTNHSLSKSPTHHDSLLSTIITPKLQPTSPIRLTPPPNHFLEHIYQQHITHTQWATRFQLKTAAPVAVVAVQHVKHQTSSRVTSYNSSQHRPLLSTNITTNKLTSNSITFTR